MASNVVGIKNRITENRTGFSWQFLEYHQSAVLYDMKNVKNFFKKERITKCGVQAKERAAWMLLFHGMFVFATCEKEDLLIAKLEEPPLRSGTLGWQTV